MTDRELLEKAAKAAGINAPIRDDHWSWPKGMFIKKPDYGWVWWNPLTDDGDALRLAVALKIEPKWPYQHEAWAATKDGVTIEEHDGDVIAATRRAIVRAAASIGETP